MLAYLGGGQSAAQEDVLQHGVRHVGQQGGTAGIPRHQRRGRLAWRGRGREEDGERGGKQWACGKTVGL